MNMIECWIDSGSSALELGVNIMISRYATENTLTVIRKTH